MTTVLELPAGQFETDDKGDRKTTRRFLVQGTTSLTEKQAESAIPVLRYDPHPEDPYCYARSATAKRSPDEYSLGVFIVEVSYDSKAEAEKDQPDNNSQPSQGDRTKPPDQRPYKYAYGHIRTEKPLGPFDKTPVSPKKVCNAVGQPFVDCPNISEYHVTLTVSGYCSLETMSLYTKQTTYLNTINDDTWEGYAAKTAKCIEFSAETEWEQNAWWWHFRIGIEFNWDGWNPVTIANRGTCFKQTNALPPQPIRDRTGQPIKDPVFLDSNGIPLPLSDEPTVVNGGLIEFLAYREQDWDGLISF
jgi:hypothetical protein